MRRMTALAFPLVKHPGAAKRAGRLLLGLALAGAAVFFASSTAARADDGGVYIAGGAVYPLANEDVRMEAETVQAVCYGRFAEYRVDFKFVNGGEPQTVQLGFPFADWESEESDPTLTAFRAWQDGKPLEVTIGEGEDPASGMSLNYYLHTATFPHGESMITVSYLAGPTMEAGARFSEDAPPALGGWGQSAWYEYWLHTGATWRGSIGKAVVRYSLADDFGGWAVDVKAAEMKGYEFAGRTTSPESYAKLDDRTYQWVFEDLDPTLDDDIVLAFTAGQPAYSGVDLPSGTYGVFVATDASERLDDRPELAAGWQAFDGWPKSAWNAAAPGVGGWLEARVQGNQSLREIRILPGRNDPAASFEEYGRPRTMRVTLSDGSSTLITLKDEPALQRFAVSGTAQWARFDIVDIYPGTKSNDTYISEIDLGTEPAPEFEPFTELITATSPPATEPAEPTQPSTTLATPTTTVPASPTSAYSPTTSPAPVGEPHTSRRLLWPALLAFGAAAAGAGTLILLGLRLRRKGQGDERQPL